MSDFIITVSDIMAECNQENEKEFQKILRSNNLALARNRDATVDIDVAVKIVGRLTGRRLDKGKYRQRNNTGERPPESLDADAAEYILQFLEQLGISGCEAPIAGSDRIVGIVSSGGFLKGENSNESILPVPEGVSLFIGERGSGKSTALSLAGVLYESLSEEAGSMVRSLLGQFAEKDEETFEWRRIFKILKGYSIERVVLYFVHHNRLIAFHACLNRNVIGSAEISGGKCTVRSGMRSLGVSPIMTIRQGEVQRVTDDANISAINELFDGLFPDLHKSRYLLVDATRRLITQAEHYRRKYQRTNPNLNTFIDEVRQTIRKLKRTIRICSFGDSESLSIISALIERCAGSKFHKSPLKELMRGSVNSFYAIMLTRRQLDLLASLAEEAKNKSVNRLNEIEDIFLSQESESEMEDDIAHEFDDDETDVKRDLPTKTYSSIDRQLRRLGTRTVSLLLRRLNLLIKLGGMFVADNVIELDDSLKALIQSYTALLGQKMENLELQQRKCRLVSETIFDVGYKTMIATANLDETVSACDSSILNAGNICESYETLSKCEIGEYLRNVEHYDNVFSGYRTSVASMLREISDLTNRDNVKASFIYDKITLHLQQGNVLREFEKLSFGQRSGILLKIVLSISNKTVVIMDQPEDNLDTVSIIQMLIPVIQKSPDKQILVATHNSNLVMGLPDSNVIAMRSFGENGGVRCRGQLSDPVVMKAALDILEGGEEALRHKMEIYRSFMSSEREPRSAIIRL